MAASTVGDELITVVDTKASTDFAKPWISRGAGSLGRKINGLLALR
jgi:hypothetical protein